MLVKEANASASFKNKLIYFLVACLVIESFFFVFKYKELVDEYSEDAYMVTNEGTFRGLHEKSYRTGPVEIRTHLRSFYSTMFSFTADTYPGNIDFAKKYLVDYGTAKYLEDVLTEADLYNKILRSNSEMVTRLDSIGKVDFSKEPYMVTAYCTQYMIEGDKKGEIPFVNTMEIVASGIARTDENPQGLQIRNWKNVATD
jgi:hypothetical protein